MGTAPKIKDCDQILIVEGYSDLLFFAELLEAIGKPPSVFIKEFGGKSNLLQKLEAFITPQLLGEKTRIGIVVDADVGEQGAQGAFASLQTRLLKLTGQTVPASGQWTGGAPAIGIFVAPDNAGKGEIETLVWNAWAADEGNKPAATCIKTFEQCMSAAGIKAKSPDKGLLGALLAICSDEDPRLGPAARTKIFDFTRPEYEPLRAFLSAF